MVLETREITVTEKDELTEVILSSNIEKTTAETLSEYFTPLFAEAKKWELQAKSILVTDITQTREMKMAREYRLKLRDIRLTADKVRKDLKEDSIRYGKAVQGMYNVIDAIVVPLEKHLDEQENFAEVQEAKRKAQIKEKRTELIKPYVGYYDSDVDLSAFTEDRFQEYLKDTIFEKSEDERKEQEEKDRYIKMEEENRLAKIKAKKMEKEAEEKEIKHREEIAKKEAEEKERLFSEKIKKEDDEKAKKEAEKAPDRDKFKAWSTQVLKCATDNIPNFITSEKDILLSECERIIKALQNYTK